MKKQILFYLVILVLVIYGFNTIKSIELSTSDTVYIKYKRKIEFYSVEANKINALEDTMYLAYREG